MLIVLFLAGLVGGAVNSLAGGGSFIVFPALLASGMPPIVANASNTYAALAGYVGGVIGFWSDLKPHRGRLLGYSAVAVVFGYVGAELLLHISNAAFGYLVPWLMGFAVLLFAFGGRANAWLTQRFAARAGAARAGAAGLLAVLAAACVYGGFFNAGFGFLLLAFFALAGMTDVLAMNGLKLWVAAVVDIVAVLRFAAGASIDWYQGTVALAGVTIGGYLAARFAHRVPEKAIRIGVVLYGTGLTAYFFWQAYAK